MSLLRLALRSLRNRRLTAGLVLVTIAASVALLLSVEKVRHGTRISFINTISGTDLIVGLAVVQFNSFCIQFSYRQCNQ